MSLKWIGALLIIAGCGGFGFQMAWSVGKEIKAFRQLVSFLDFLSCELSYRMTPLPDAIRMALPSQTGCIKSVMTKLVEELDSQIAPDVASCMSASVGKVPNIPASVRSVLLEFGSLCGNFDLDGQQQGLQYIKQLCQNTLEQLEANRVQRTRSYQTLGLCAGAALAILLV